MKRYLLGLLGLLAVVSEAGFFADRNTIEGTSVIATNGGTSALVYNDPRNLVWIGSSNQTIKLPSATSMRVGFVFRMRNAGTGSLSVQLNDGTALHTLEPNVVGEYLLTAKGTANGSWSVMEHQPNVVTSLGDMVYGTTGGSVARVAGNTSAGVQFLVQQGTGSVSASPGWSTLSAVLGTDTNSNIPSLQVTNITNSTSPGTGALRVSGGLGVGDSAYFGGSVVSYGGLTTRQNIVIEDPGAGQNNITIQAPTLTSNYALVLPNTDGDSGQVLSSDGSGNLSWTTAATASNSSNNPYELSNYGLAVSTAANAMTIALKTKDGGDPDGSDSVTIGFRNGSSAVGSYTQASVSSALSLTISAGSTLGTTSGASAFVYVYAVNNSGTVSLAAIGRSTVDEGTLQHIFAEGGAGAADGASVLYGPATLTSKPVRLIGRLNVNEATAGTWDAVPIEISLPPFEDLSQIISTGRYGVRFASARIANTGTASIITQDGDWLTAATKIGTGRVDLTFKPQLWPQAPSCVCAYEDNATSAGMCAPSPISVNTVTVRTVDSSNTSTDKNFNIHCVGGK